MSPNPGSPLPLFRGGSHTLCPPGSGAAQNLSPNLITEPGVSFLYNGIVFLIGVLLTYQVVLISAA